MNLHSSQTNIPNPTHTTMQTQANQQTEAPHHNPPVRVKSLTGGKVGYIEVLRLAADYPKPKMIALSYLHGVGFCIHYASLLPAGAVWTRAYFERGAIEPMQPHAYTIYRRRILETLNSKCPPTPQLSLLDIHNLSSLA